jgi:hypothetical protein
LPPWITPLDSRRSRRVFDSVPFGVIGTFVGIFGAAWAIWQWLDTKQKGDVMIGFLHRLKTGELQPLQSEQVNDMLARFDPPRKAKCVPKKNTGGVVMTR